MSLFSSLSHLATAPGPVLHVCDESGKYRVAQEAEVLAAAQRVMATKIPKTDYLSSPNAVKDFLRVRLGALPHEVFAVVHLDSQHSVIEYVEMFRGTTSQTSVYIREIVLDALHHNAACVLLVHNHPTHQGAPSRADEHLTQTAKQALKLIDIRVLDHLIVAGDNIVSMAELGLI